MRGCEGAGGGGSGLRPRICYSLDPSGAASFVTAAIAGAQEQHHPPHAFRAVAPVFEWPFRGSATCFHPSLIAGHHHLAASFPNIAYRVRAADLCPLLPAGLNMGRMTHRQKLRNEPKARTVCPRCLPLLATSCRSTRAKLRNEPNEPGASVVGQAVSPANFQATKRKITKRTQGPCS